MHPFHKFFKFESFQALTSQFLQIRAISCINNPMFHKFESLQTSNYLNYPKLNRHWQQSFFFANYTINSVWYHQSYQSSIRKLDSLD